MHKCLIGGALALALLLPSACSDPEDPSGGSTERGIETDIRATHDAGAARLRTIGIYDSPQMYSPH